jgi:hypothetical protein
MVVLNAAGRVTLHGPNAAQAVLTPKHTSANGPPQERKIFFIIKTFYQKMERKNNQRTPNKL